MVRQKDLEAKLNNSTDFFGVLSLGSVVLSGILLFSPARAVGYIGIGSGLGAFTASIVTRRKHLQVARQHVDDLTSHHRIEVSLQNDLLVSKDNEIHTLRADNGKRFKKIEALSQELNQSGNQLAQLQNQIDGLMAQRQSQQQLLERVTGELDRLLDTARVAVEESLDEWDTRLCSLVNTKREQYPKLTERLTDLLREGQGLIAEYEAKLSETPKKWDSLADLLSLYYVCNDDLANIKTKCIQAIAKLSNQEKEKDLDEWNESYQALEERYKLLLKEYCSKVDECNRNAIENSNNAKAIIEEFTVKTADDVEANWKNATDFVQQLKGEIQRLEEKVEELSKPLKYPGAIRSDMKIANIVIEYFYRLGMILDRAGTEYRQYEATLEFNSDRTGRLILPKDLNDHSDALQKLTHTLNKPEFKLDPETGLLTLLVRWANKPAVDNTDLAKRLLTPVDEVVKKLVDNLSHKPTIRVMGATGEGKGVMVRYLLKSILANHSWYCRLHDPQHGSSEDYWGIPKVSKSGNELKQALKGIESQMLYREANGWDVTTLDTLDEIDTHLERKEKKESFIDLVSRIRHLGMKLILIGQNPKVGRAGFEWSDMQQMNCIYMGASAFDAIETNPQLKPRKDKLTKDYITLSEHYEKVNEGLDDGEKYLFGLVVIPGKSPLWIELPRPDSIEINCNELLLGESFTIPDSLVQLIEDKNTANYTGFFGKTNSNSKGSAKAETLTQQEEPRQPGSPDYAGVTALDGSRGSFGSPICKQHPDAKLTTRKDGRHYCPSCKKRLAKTDVGYR
ncbi:MAG TPA: hypothetical protein V6D14_17530 [Coleofasciculaceae cyanobacterium]